LNCNLTFQKYRTFDAQKEQQKVKLTKIPTKQEALGSIVTSPVIKPTSENSSLNSLYFWLLSALIGEVYMTRCLFRNDIAIAYNATTVFPAEVWADT
jgi:hypothetical protein